MHCLFVTSLLPEAEPSTGFEIANASILRAFREAGARVTVAGFRRAGDRSETGERDILLGERAIETARAPAADKARWLARGLLRRLPLAAAKLLGLTEARLAATLGPHGPFDAVILNSFHMPAAYPSLARLAPTIYVAHNVEALSARQNAKTAPTVLERWLYAREARLLERLEARLCADAACVLALSGEDLVPLGLEGDPRARLMPLALGRAGRKATARKRDIGLIGTWSWAPNRAGLDWFLAEVAPRLAPSLRVEIAGRLPDPQPRAPAGVRFLGRVPDADAFLAETAVVALATRGGTGIQLKTLEVLEAGIPAVATSAALRGVEAELPADVVVADEAGAFAEALGRLASRPAAEAPPEGEPGSFAREQRRRAAIVAGEALALARTARPRAEGQGS